MRPMLKLSQDLNIFCSRKVRFVSSKTTVILILQYSEVLTNYGKTVWNKKQSTAHLKQFISLKNLVKRFETQFQKEKKPYFI